MAKKQIFRATTGAVIETPIEITIHETGFGYSNIQKANGLSGKGQLTSMDPKLQQAILLRRSGLKKAATSSTSEDEVAVIAQITDTVAWNELTEVRTPKIISAIGNQQTIVTGRIPIQRIEFIRALPYVKSLKAARRLSPAIHITVPDIGADKFEPASSGQTGGKGVIVGIIDFGCDYAHKNFLSASGKTRLIQLWDQTASTNDPQVDYGRLYSATEINQALKKADPYGALSYQIELNEHGTHVMDIATGNGKGSGAPGVAPGADIIFVQPSSSSIPWQGPETLEKNFGDSVNLIEAVRHIFDKAGDLPCVINISLGTNGGPHDGSTLVEKGIDGMLEEKPNRAVVIAASNSHDDGIHTAGSVAAKDKTDLVWIVNSNDPSENEMEIWYKGADRLTVEVFDPKGKSLGTLKPSEAGQVEGPDGRVQMVISNRLNDPNNNDNVIGIWMSERNGGNWTVRLINNGKTPVDFHAWIERDDVGQSRFGGTIDNSHTLGSISCGYKSITVSSYDATKKAFPISWFSSEGPTRDGRLKPEIAAPGSNVMAAASTTKTGRVIKSGTSMAAPAVTGAIALIYSAAEAKGKSLSIDELRDIITKKGRLTPPVKVWDSRFGHGRIFLPDMIDLITAANSGTSPKTGVKKPKKVIKKAVRKKKVKRRS